MFLSFLELESVKKFGDMSNCLRNITNSVFVILTVHLQSAQLFLLENGFWGHKWS